VVISLERAADLHMAQLMPLPLTVSCFSKIQIGYTFLVPAHPGSLGKRAVKRVCVCVCVCVCAFILRIGKSLAAGEWARHAAWQRYAAGPRDRCNACAFATQRDTRSPIRALSFAIRALVHL